jgi:hypothetical protein
MEEAINQRLQFYKTLLVLNSKNTDFCDLAITSVANEILYIKSDLDIIQKSNSIAKLFELVMQLPDETKIVFNRTIKPQALLRANIIFL